MIRFAMIQSIRDKLAAQAIKGRYGKGFPVGLVTKGARKNSFIIAKYGCA